MAIVNAASAALADVVTAIAAANAGDTVQVPAGNATWASQLYYTKAINLVGAGIGVTNITSGYTAPYTYFNNANYLLRYSESAPATNNPVRISGFSFDFDNKCEGLMVYNDSATAISKLRIDHCDFSKLPLRTTRFLHIDGTVYGCVDNNVFHADDAGLTYRIVTVYGSVGSDLGVGQWTTNTYTSGSANNVYFEDNDIYWVGLDFFSCGAGGRYCVRHNNWHYVDEGRWTCYFAESHGNMGSGGNMGALGIDFYENTADGAFISNPFDMFDMRGGKGVLYNNHLPSTVASLKTQVREEFNDVLNPPASNVLSGQPQYLSDYYVWGNEINSVDQVSVNLPYVGSTIDYGGGTGVVPRNDVHFWRQVASFDGTTGIGVGLLAARPATCTKGVAYWATDTSILYRAVATNTWEVYYTPYTYPHPLRAEGAAPDTLTVISPNGAESWAGNSEHDIIWTNTGTTVYDNVKIQYSTDAGVTWTQIVASTPNTGTYAWTVPNATGSYLIKVSAVV